jgi:hypothetical protein
MLKETILEMYPTPKGAGNLRKATKQQVDLSEEDLTI